METSCGKIIRSRPFFLVPALSLSYLLLASLSCVLLNGSEVRGLSSSGKQFTTLVSYIDSTDGEEGLVGCQWATLPAFPSVQFAPGRLLIILND